MASGANQRLTLRLRSPQTRYRPVSRIAAGGMAEVWLAKTLGAEGFTIRSEADIAPVLDAALAPRRVPAVVHVHASALQVTAFRRRKA